MSSQPTNYFNDHDFNPHDYPCSPTILHNLSELHEKLNQVREAYGKPMIVTSGLRSQADQMRINPKAPKSNHLMGLAADIQDKDGKLAEWVKANMSLMEQIGFWFEDFDHTEGWVHFQCVPPKSGKRVFIP